MKTNEKIIYLEDLLDEHFPKGHKERGKALVIVAMANLEIKKSRQEGAIEGQINCLETQIKNIKGVIKELGGFKETQGVRGVRAGLEGFIFQWKIDINKLKSAGKGTQQHSPVTRDSAVASQKATLKGDGEL